MPAGVWKVALDMGISTPRPVDFAAMGAAPRPRYKGKADGATQQKALMSREARTLSTAGAAASAGTYADMLAPDVRLHRDGMMPLVGPCRRRQGSARSRRAHRMDAAGGPDAADSGDLAVSYGKYREIARSGKSAEGFYTHLVACATPPAAGAVPTTSGSPQRDDLGRGELEGNFGLAPGNDVGERLAGATGHRPAERAVAGVEPQVAIARHGRSAARCQGVAPGAGPPRNARSRGRPRPGNSSNVRSRERFAAAGG